MYENGHVSMTRAGKMKAKASQGSISFFVHREGMELVMVRMQDG